MGNCSSSEKESFLKSENEKMQKQCQETHVESGDKAGAIINGECKNMEDYLISECPKLAVEDNIEPNDLESFVNKKSDNMYIFFVIVFCFIYRREIKKIFKIK